MGVRAMVSSRPSQNQKRKASKREKGKTVCNCLRVDLDTGERLPIYAFLSLLPLSIVGISRNCSELDGNACFQVMETHGISWNLGEYSVSVM